MLLSELKEVKKINMATDQVLILNANDLIDFIITMINIVAPDKY